MPFKLYSARRALLCGRGFRSAAFAAAVAASTVASSFAASAVAATAIAAAIAVGFVVVVRGLERAESALGLRRRSAFCPPG